MLKEIFSESHRASLRDISQHNLFEILKLEVADYQKKFVAPNAVSIAQAHYESTAWYKGIYVDNQPVGFVMLDIHQEAGDYFLWRFMIDQRYQGQGYGKEALELIIQYLIEMPNAIALNVSCIPGENSPLSFYKSFGFEETGEWIESECVLTLDLHRFKNDLIDGEHFENDDHELHEDESFEEVELVFLDSLKSEDDLWLLYEALNWNAYLKLQSEKLNTAMTNSYKVMYGYIDNHLIATGRLISDGITNAYLCGVGVHPDYRGQGIGSNISKQLMHYALENGLTIQLFCEDHLIPFYEALGCKTFATGMKINKKF